MAISLPRKFRYFKFMNDTQIYELYLRYNPLEDISGDLGRAICDVINTRMLYKNESIEKWLMLRGIEHLELEAEIEQIQEKSMQQNN